MGDAEVQRGQEYNLFSREVSQDMEGYDEGSPNQFFADRPLFSSVMHNAVEM